MDTKYKGRIVETYSSATPGAWDNWALPERSYYGYALTEEGKLELVCLGHSDDGALPEPDASPEIMEAYKKMQEEAHAKKRAEQAERELHTPRLGKKMEVLKGKNKGFVGIVKWVGETRFGESALLINEAGEKVFTKPTNLKFLEAAVEGPKVEVGSKVTVKMGQHAGKAGTVEWMGETKYGYKAKVNTSSGVVWAKPGNLEVSDEAEVKALIA